VKNEIEYLCYFEKGAEENYPIMVYSKNKYHNFFAHRLKIIEILVIIKEELHCMYCRKWFNICTTKRKWFNINFGM